MKRLLRKLCAVLTCLWITGAQAEIRFDGLSRTTERAVRASVALADEPCDASEPRIRRLYRRADGEIREALEVFGYYEPVIEKTLSRDQECWQADITVERGPRVLLRDIEVRIEGAGSEQRRMSRQARNAPFERGQGLNQREYDEFKASLASLAQRYGYFDGHYTTARIDVFPAERAADVKLVFESGERYRFGEVTIEQDVISPRLAERFIEIEPGEPYDAERITDLYTALLASGYFQNVEIRPTPKPAPDLDVPIVIVMTASTPRTATAGVGFATDTGAKIRLGFLHQRLNSRGHQFEFDSSLAQTLGDATLSYRVPGRAPRDEWLSFETGFKYEEPEDSRSDEFRLGLKQVIRRSGLWRETRSIEYRRETFQVGEVDGTSKLVVPGIAWSNQPRVVPRRPRRGQRVSLRVSGTDEWLGSNTAFLQTEATGRIILPLWSTARLIARAEAGWTLQDEFEELPFSVRFFAGGDDSVRGYDYKTLGPTDAEGNVIGGSDKLVGSVELDQRILPNWSVAAFIDVGNAFDTFKDLTLKRSVGAGVRWYSPLGPVRLDVGVPLDHDAPDSFRVHVTLGPDL